MLRQLRQLARLAQQLLKLDDAARELFLLLPSLALRLLAQRRDARADAQRILPIDEGHLI